MSPKLEEDWLRMALYRPGLLLVTGNSPSGKTTTAYATFARLNRVERKLFTVEETRTYDLQGVIQISSTTTAAIDSVLRQDPNGLFVGNISAQERAHVALEAAASGILVLATLPSGDAVSALQRLTEMGPFFPSRVARLVTGVLAQDLVRRICPDCREEYESNTMELHRYLPEDTLPIPGVVTLYRGKGCEACKETGYRGRIGVFELLSPGEEFREQLAERKYLIGSLRGAARSSFVSTFGTDLSRKLLAGVTTFDEVRRVLAKRPGF